MVAITEPDSPHVRVSASDLAHIVDTRPGSTSGYHGVYRLDGKTTFEAHFFQRKICSGQPTPREAAIILVRRWKATFGAHWRDAWYYRQTQGWVVWRDIGGWWGLAEIVGQAVVMIGRHPQFKWACPVAETPGCKPFPTERAARRGMVAWAKRLWGKGRRFVVRRTYCPGRSAARAVPTPVPQSAGR